jgi:hypothetical protein
MIRQAGPVLYIITRKVCRILVKKFEGKRLLGIPAHRWEYNEMDLKQGMEVLI